MIWFSYIYLGSRMVVMDVQEDRSPGFRTYVASLSEDPRVNFRALSANDALERLVAYLRAPRITFLPEQIESRRLERSGV